MIDSGGVVLISHTLAPTGVELWAKYGFWKKLFRVAPLFYGFYGTMILTREPVEAAFWPENRDPDQIKHAIGQNIMKFGDFCILIFRNFENCKQHLKFDTQSFDRIFQFTLFLAPRIGFWPEIRVPDQIKHAISRNIMKFGDCWLHFFRNSDPVSGPFFLCVFCFDTVSMQ